MPTIYIDNKPFEVKAGKNLLESCLTMGFDLPYFCWHPAMGSVGACRQCAVMSFKDEGDTHGRLVMSCMESVRDGLRISITDKTAKAFRAQVIEWLMTNHPHDCPVCDEGGSCHLQDMTVMTGHDYRRFRYKKRTFVNQYLGPLIHHEMNRCIECYRCVRFYRDYAGGKDLNVFAAHNHVYFGRENEGVLESPFSGNLAEVCPTGVFTDKTLKEHYTRKWDLTTAPSVCQHCSLGCNIIAGERYGELRCIVNRYNSEVNGYFLCDRGRFGYEFVNSENRITQAVIRSRSVEAVDEAGLMGHLKGLLSANKLIGIGSPRASVESNYSLMELVGTNNFYQGVNEDEAFLEKRVVEILESGSLHSASLKDIEQADAILVLGEDIWNTAPMMALAVRQSVMKTAAAQALQHTSLSAWHDIAVKELVQEDKGFLANVTVTSSPLDEIAALKLHESPDDMVRLGFAVAQRLIPSLEMVPLADKSIAMKAKAIAAALQQAKRPVIISGGSSCDEALIRAAFDIAAALNTPERKAAISYVLPECNSMGLAMMHAPSLEKAVGRVAREQDITVVILENDLYRRLPAVKADAFFSRCKNIIVLDSLHNLTTEKAHVLIPAATFAEAEGTLVNNEGRAQSFYKVLAPANNITSAHNITSTNDTTSANNAIPARNTIPANNTTPANNATPAKNNSKESWRWLRKMRALQMESGNGHELHSDELLLELEKALPQFHGISGAAPAHDFRIHGQSIPREPHRYSGRTAMLANLAVSEPKPMQDSDSPLSFTMEGYKGMPPASMIPFYWSPGWNSVQSENKYQQEIGGALRGGDPGIRLFEQKAATTPALFKDIPEAFAARHDKWLLLPQHHLFGSGELSVYSKAIRQLSPDPYIGLSKDDAEQLGAVNGSVVAIKTREKEYKLPLKIEESLCNGIAIVPKGLPGMDALNWGTWVSINFGVTESV